MTTTRFQLVLLSVFCVVLVAAAPPLPVADQVRAGNDAFGRGDWDAAEALYAEAEERSPDPGLVAFNKGTALYRRGDVRRAELCFRRALGDAEVPVDRKERTLYNLGNCLVRQAGDTDVKLLQAAIECFERVLRDAPDEGVRTDAGHNLEVAKLLWAKARAKRPPGERDPEWDEPRDPKRPPPNGPKPPDPNSSDSGDGPKKSDAGPKVDLGKGPEAGMISQETEKAAPGAGNLPVLPDTGRVESLAPEDARAVLKKAAERLQRERRKLREETTPGDRPRAKDW
jgi:tetratricopeptide (TPR) repeat protein